MSERNDQSDSTTSARTREVALALLIICGLALAIALSRWLERHRAPELLAAQAEGAEELYVSPQAARRISLGFNGLVADWYWMRALQYVGRKVEAHEGNLEIDDLSALNIKLLAPLLDHATTLDPQFMAAYEYGAVVLPTIDREAAIKLIKKGIKENPQTWRLYYHLGYIYWQQGNFQESSEAYRTGGLLPGAPSFMKVMAAQMLVKGGSRETARAIYRTMYEQTDDDSMKTLAYKRLLQLQSFDEEDAIRRVLGNYRAQAGRCANSWREVGSAFAAMRLPTDRNGAPLDPTGVPYTLNAGACDVELGDKSEILREKKP